MNYSYEIVIIDKNGKSEITTPKSLSNALGYSEKLWTNSIINEKSGEYSISDENLGLLVKINKLNSQETAFVISTESNEINKLESFRINLLTHASKIGFDTIKLISDSVTEKISADIYPQIKEVENQLRKLLIRSNLLNTNLEGSFSNATRDKIQKRKENSTSFNGLLDTNICLTDFDDLTTLINNSNNFNQDFKNNWTSLSILRDKVLTYSPLNTNDLATTKNVIANILAILSGKEVKTPAPAPVVSQITENKTIVENIKHTENTANKIEEATKTVVSEPVVSKPIYETKVEATVVQTELQNTKPVNIEVPKIDPIQEQSPKKTISVGFEMISENTFLNELKNLENSNGGRVINLKDFVNNILADKGFAAGSCYSVSKNLNDNGKVSLFETKDEVGLTVKVIKSL